nr:ATP-binding cassette domain-containing protein [Tamaricihabitans halophyticus]
MDVIRTYQHPSGPVDVLRGVRLNIDSGELVTLSGRSGSGKSALLAMLSGFDSPDAGTIHVDGQPIVEPPHWARCAVLPQTFGLATELTVAENVALPLRLGDSAPSPAALSARVNELLAELGIDTLTSRYPPEISFGQQQRVALARAVAARPRVLLADEPTAHLDNASMPPVLRMLRQCADEGAAVLVATHDQHVHEIADRQVQLRDGVIVTPTEDP